uniref:Uncharacterized protein n=1 Tax=Rhizophora mucronata TaxID=61149 RepID=A0A2P2N6M7_RHIMU
MKKDLNKANFALVTKIIKLQGEAVKLQYISKQT